MMPSLSGSAPTWLETALRCVRWFSRRLRRLLLALARWLVSTGTGALS
jgi:hypothetical protein